MQEKDLIKSVWTKEDIDLFNEYLYSFSKGEESVKFEKRVVNTEYNCIAVPSAMVDKFVKLIYKGNYISFIDMWDTSSYTSLIITGKLIAKIKDFNLFEKYLIEYLSFVDCWGGTDCLKLNVREEDKGKYFGLAKRLIGSAKTFYRRMGVIILFKLIDDYIDEILNICSSLNVEQEYYVNMAVAWLIAECFAKYREKTLCLIRQKTLNKFVQNKAISKCNDSFRISKEDKLMLKAYRV